VAGAQIAGGLLTPYIRRLFRRRTTALILAEVIGTVAILLIGLILNFWIVIVLIVVWALLFAAVTPIRQAFINGLIPSQQRATILSFDSLMSSTGGVVAQPVLGRAADVWGYPASYVLSSGISALAIPFMVLARRQNSPVDAEVAPTASPTEATTAEAAAGEATTRS
jgi:MFS family permease